jgi:adenylate cyclase
MVLQVEQTRRDIAYNGDTINIAACIESLCNEYQQALLISGDP